MENWLTHVFNFVPAEYYPKRKRPCIEFHAKDPVTGELRLKRIYMAHIRNARIRKRTAQEVCRELNRKLAEGWNPWIDDDDNSGGLQFTPLEKAINAFLQQSERRYKDGYLKYQTIVSYRSMTKLFRNWFKAHFKDRTDRLNGPLVRDFNQVNIQRLVSEQFYDLEKSARTANNYRTYAVLLAEWFVSSGYLKAHNIKNVKRIKDVKDKTRQIIPHDALQRIFRYLEKEDFGYYVCCRLLYCCFVRRTEMTGLKISDLQLKDQLIKVRSEISKNRKTQYVTVPDSLARDLATYFSLYSNNLAQEDYLIGENFRPGPNKLSEREISIRWADIRKPCNLKMEHQWYSLKDTGIQNMLEDGVPAIAVRDQARHHDLSITNIYTKKSVGEANKNLKSR